MPKGLCRNIRVSVRFFFFLFFFFFCMFYEACSVRILGLCSNRSLNAKLQEVRIWRNKGSNSGPCFSTCQVDMFWRDEELHILEHSKYGIQLPGGNLNGWPIRINTNCSSSSSRCTEVKLWSLATSCTSLLNNF